MAALDSLQNTSAHRIMKSALLASLFLRDKCCPCRWYWEACVYWDWRTGTNKDKKRPNNLRRTSVFQPQKRAKKCVLILNCVFFKQSCGYLKNKIKKDGSDLHRIF